MQRPESVEARSIHDVPDVLQAVPNFAEEQYLLQGQNRALAIEAVAIGISHIRLQQTDPVVVVQRPYAHTRQPRQLSHCVGHGNGKSRL